MLKTIAARLITISACAGLALGPVAASANTRAGASGAIYATNLSAQIVADDNTEEAAVWLRENGRLLAIILSLTAAGALIWLIDDEIDHSGGT